MNKKYFNIAHKNLRDTIKHRVSNIDGGKMFETDDFLLFSIGIPTDDGHLNGCLSFNDSKYKNTLNQAKKFFRDLGLNFSFWIRDKIDINLEQILKEKGYKPSREPGSSVMITKNRIKDGPLPDGYKLKEIDSLDYAKDLKSVIKEGFEKDKQTVNTMFSSKENVISKNIKSFCIYNDKGKAVSAAITSITPNSAGIYYVATLESERSKGLGKAITKASTNAGFDSDRNIVILQASELGEYVYSKLNYNKIGIYRTYKYTINKS